mgnify:CR=1 FL=1
MHVNLHEELEKFICKQMPKVTSVNKAIILSEWYETAVGLYNHFNNNNSRPIASVAMHPEEDTIRNSLLEFSIKKFAVSNIYQTFGLNYEEFIQLPSYVCKIMIETAFEELRKKSKVAQSVEEEFKDLETDK